MDNHTEEENHVMESLPYEVKNDNKTDMEVILTWGKHGTLDSRSFKRRVWKNIFLISLVFMFNFLSFGGLTRLQSTLHSEEGMGVICTSVLYVAVVIGCLLVPKPLIHWLGHKWALTISLIAYILWMAANAYAIWATMIPASILVGIFAGPLWTSQCSYFTELGKRYAVLTQQEERGVIALFFGIFFMFFQASTIFGSIISSTVLSQAPPDNYTAPSNDVIEEFCGMSDCPWLQHNNTNLENPPQKVVITLCAVYIAIAVVAFIISALFVDNLPNPLKKKENGSRSIYRETFHLIGCTIRQIKNRKQLLLIAITIYSGVEQSFAWAELNKSWVTCALGIWMVGAINIPFAITDAGISFASGSLNKYLGRLPLFITALVLDNCIQITLATWTVNLDQTYVYYILPTLWGASDGIWQTQINALYGSIFQEDSEAAFSNYRLWESCGFIIAFGYSSFLCTSVKLYIMYTLLWFGLIGYFIVEWIHYKETRKVALKEDDKTLHVKLNAEMG